MSITLVLGGVLFQSFELPERIAWGGTQRLSVHRLPGGARIIDAMGRDDARLEWSGVFSGSDAGGRARLLDLMRAAGDALPLSWDSFFYSAVIDTLHCDYARSNWIPYRIGCTVLRDEAQAAVVAALSLGAVALGDLAAATTGGVDLTGATAALAATDATTRGSAAFAAATQAVTAAATSIASGIAGGETALASAALTNAAGLGSAASACGTLAGLAAAQGYVHRVAVNLANAST